MFYPIATHLVLAKTLANLALFWGPILATWLGVIFFVVDAACSPPCSRSRSSESR